MFVVSLRQTVKTENPLDNKSRPVQTGKSIEIEDETFKHLFADKKNPRYVNIAEFGINLENAGGSYDVYPLAFPMLRKRLLEGMWSLSNLALSQIDKDIDDGVPLQHLDKEDNPSIFALEKAGNLLRLLRVCRNQEDGSLFIRFSHEE